MNGSIDEFLVGQEPLLLPAKAIHVQNGND